MHPHNSTEAGCVFIAEHNHQYHLMISNVEAAVMKTLPTNVYLMEDTRLPTKTMTTVFGANSRTPTLSTVNKQASSPVETSL